MGATKELEIEGDPRTVINYNSPIGQRGRIVSVIGQMEAGDRLIVRPKSWGDRIIVSVINVVDGVRLFTATER